MSKTILKFDNDNQYDFILIGMVCQCRDYRLCFELNNKLKIDLTKGDDYEIFSNKRMSELKFSFFEFENNDEDKYYIFANKCVSGLLIPEQKQIDYFLMIDETFKRINETALINSLKEIPVVLGAFKFDASKLKSRENLLF